MARASSGFPIRVAVIAGVLAVALVVLVWFVSSLGRPAGEPVAELEPEVATAPEPEQAEPLVDGEPSTLGTLVDTETVTLQLFVIDPAARRLVPRIRRIEAPMTLPAQAQLALERLVRTRDAGFLPPLPADTVVREVWVSPAGVAYVDFSQTFPRLIGGGSLAEIHAVYGVVATLTSSFPNIRSVQFLVNGEPIDTLSGHIDLSRPVEPLADWVY